jgi:hypothetical protein
MGEFQLGSKTESISIGESERVLDLADPQSNPVIEPVSPSEARERWADALPRLPALAGYLEHPSPELANQLGARTEPRWMLLLDHDEPLGLDQRPHLAGLRESPPRADARPHARPPLSEVLEPIELDTLTVADDPGSVDVLQQGMNLPAAIQRGLPDLY